MVLPATEQKPGTTRTLLKDNDGGVVRRTVLPGGLRVITELVPGVRSASLGVWLGVGSRDEAPGLAGASHFLEHLLFKGTRQRTALEISTALDRVGGELNAFTSKEYTCYHARVLDDDLPLAIDVVADMVASSVVARDDVERERKVILDEIAMHDDDPDDAVQNLFHQRMWAGTRLEHPVFGSVGSISELSREQLVRYYRRRYRSDKTVVAVAGNVNHADVVRKVRAAWSTTSFMGDCSDRPRAPRSASPVIRASSGAGLLHRRTEQALFVLGVPGVSRGDDRRFALGVLNAVLGGGPSSRLFQEIRERRGLAYAVYSYVGHFADAGVLAVGAGCLPGDIDDVIAISRQELHRMAESGLTPDELERGKGQLKGGTVLSLEDSESRMSRIGKSELLYGELLSINELLGRVDAVTLDDVRDVARSLLGVSPTLAVIGPFDDPAPFEAVVS
ncbi:MAG: insulinase family protein [Propionibacteriales bacterium]|nr:insulinase family protein [Propionibacteriales bacterium]